METTFFGKRKNVLLGSFLDDASGPQALYFTALLDPLWPLQTRKQTSGERVMTVLEVSFLNPKMPMTAQRSLQDGLRVPSHGSG